MFVFKVDTLQINSNDDNYNEIFSRRAWKKGVSFTSDDENKTGAPVYRRNIQERYKSRDFLSPKRKNKPRQDVFHCLRSEEFSINVAFGFAVVRYHFFVKTSYLLYVWYRNASEIAPRMSMDRLTTYTTNALDLQGILVRFSRVS